MWAIDVIVCLNVLEMEMMKERFAKLLLGEDMSGSGKGVSTALAVSNAITNLCGKYYNTFFWGVYFVFIGRFVKLPHFEGNTGMKCSSPSLSSGFLSGILG